MRKNFLAIVFAVVVGGLCVFQIAHASVGVKVNGTQQGVAETINLVGFTGALGATGLNWSSDGFNLTIGGLNWSNLKQMYGNSNTAGSLNWQSFGA